ncbi:hypothetical protein AAEU23_004719 [Escherichia coli]|nr:hypothetical protein [Escherichia coli]
MASNFNEKGVTLIEGAFVMLLFCIVFSISVYYINLTMVVSKALEAGQQMYLVGSQLEQSIKSGECICKTADEDCKECVKKKIEKLYVAHGFTIPLRTSLRSLSTEPGVGVLIYPMDTRYKSFADLDEIYFTSAASKEKAVIIDGTKNYIISPISKVSFAINGVTDNNQKYLTLNDFGIDTTLPGRMYPGIYFEIPI